MSSEATSKDDGARESRAVLEAMSEAGLDPAYAAAVRQMLEEDEQAWAGCCGSSCDPCNATLALAARLARRRLQEG